MGDEMPNPASIRNANEAIEPDVRLLASVIEHSPLGMSLTPVDRNHPTRLDQRVVLVNQALADMLGYTRDELLEATDQGALTHPEDRPLDRAHVKHLVDGAVSWEQWEKRYLHRDGHLVWGRVSTSLIRATDGTPRWLVAQIEDITRRREAEQALAEAQTELLEHERRTAKQLQEALDTRLIVEQAKGMLAGTYDVGVDAAFELLRKYARNHRAKIRDVADAVVNHGLRP
jgi:two-component system C4-dicarboxylate transport sensor histidine kinase DctB